MKSRKKMTRKGSRLYFTKNARKTEVRNIAPPPMRGGIRL